MRKNIQALNYDFEKKKKAYQNSDNVISSFVITQDIINGQKWDIEILEKREKKLLHKINEVLDIFE